MGSGGLHMPVKPLQKSRVEEVDRPLLAVDDIDTLQPARGAPEDLAPVKHEVTAFDQLDSHLADEAVLASRAEL